MENSEKYIKHILENGIQYGGVISNYLINNFGSLNIEIDLSSNIRKKISEKKDFEINPSESQNLLSALEKKIEELLKNENFDPLKEGLRKQFPHQYESHPFKFRGKQYYLYPKGFEIDSLIIQTIGFKKLVEEHLKKSKSIKYFFKE